MPAKKEAAIAVAFAAEEFMQRFCTAAERVAAGKSRTSVRQDDVKQLTRRVDEYMFLLGTRRSFLSPLVISTKPLLVWLP